MEKQLLLLKWLLPLAIFCSEEKGPLTGFRILCSFKRWLQDGSNLRVRKENRAAGVLENFEEGKRYNEPAFRKFVRGRHTEVMPNVNKFFSDPNN